MCASYWKELHHAIGTAVLYATIYRRGRKHATKCLANKFAAHNSATWWYFTW